MRYQIELTGTDKTYMRVQKDCADMHDASLVRANLAFKYFHGVIIASSISPVQQPQADIEIPRSAFADASALLVGLVLLNQLFNYFGM